MEKELEKRMVEALEKIANSSLWIKWLWFAICFLAGVIIGK